MPPIQPISLSTAAAPPTCRVAFGAERSGIRLLGGHRSLQVALPFLGGAETEVILEADHPPTEIETGVVFGSDERLGGFILARPGMDLESAAREVYGRVFAATRTLKLYRIWNYVPQINRVDDGLEN